MKARVHPAPRHSGARAQAREPGIHNPGAAAYGFRAHRFAVSRNDGETEPRLASGDSICWIAALTGGAAMIPFFVQIKCELGKAYQVANALAEAEIASEIYSTAGDYDLLVKFYVDADTDIGHFINEKVQTLPGVKDTYTIITFKAFT
jgi:DNA-binding Lrp family transcriptional regulator